MAATMLVQPNQDVDGVPASGSWLTQSATWYAAVASLALLQVVLVATHRPWLDEWQALQLALQSPTLADLLANLRYEGHPPLWYFMLRGAAAVIPVQWVLPLVVGLLAVAGQSAILFASPFSRLQRLCLAFGALMLFEYFTLSRSLSLGVTCLLLATALRGSRWAFLPIALLPFCDFLFGVLSFALVVLQWRDGRLWRPGLVIWIISGAAAAWTVIPAPDMIQALERLGPASDFFGWISRLGVLLIPLQTGSEGFMWNGMLPLGLGTICGPLFLWFGYRQTRGDPLHLALFGGFALLTLVFSLLVYPLHTRHLSLLALLLILLKWRDAARGVLPDAAFAAWLGVGAICGLVTAAINLSRPFDTAHEAAAYIERHGLADKQWLVFPDSRAQGVSALSGVEFQRLERGCTQSFIRWNYRTTIRDWDDLGRELRAITGRQGRVYLLSDFPVNRLTGLVRPLASFDAGYDGQEYYLSVVRPDLPETSYRAPPCAPHRRRLDQGTIWSR